MTIEIRQMLIKSSVEVGATPARAAAEPPADCCGDAPDAERSRMDMLAECKAWLAERMQNQHER